MRTNRPHFKESGFSMIETIVGLAVALTLTGVCGAVMVDTFAREGKFASLAAGGIAEMQTVQTIHSTKKLRRLLRLSTSPQIERCLQQTGAGCQGLQSQNLATANLNDANLSRFSGSGGNCTSLSEKCPFDQEVLYRWKCSSPHGCEGVEVTVRMKRYQFESGSAGAPNLSKVNESKFFVKATDLALAPNVDYGSCQGKILVGIDPNTKKVICRDNRKQVSCNGFSVIGVGSDECGSAPPKTETHVCTLSLNTTASGLRLDFSATGPGSSRVAYNCTRTGSTTGDISDIYYHRYLPYVSGSRAIPLNSGSVQVDCTADIRGDGQTPLASCSARYTYTAPTPKTAQNGSQNKKGKGQSTSNGGWGNKTNMNGSSSSSSSSTSASVTGNGGGFNTSIKSGTSKSL